MKKLPQIGWREWVALPELGIEKIKAKIDTGARTSAIHAFSIKPFKQDGLHKIHFDIHPLQHRINHAVSCVAEVHDIRWVTDSGGHKERRYVIKTPLQLGKEIWPVEITLTNRDTMRFRMLLGRSAIKQHFTINPAGSYLINLKS
jgi:hypothetical protein